MSLILSGDTPKITADSTGVITSGAAVASTSGTAIDFTDIPNWVKRITVMFSGVSLSGTSDILVQLGVSSGVENTGYTSFCSTLGTSGISQSTSTTGFIIRLQVASLSYHGQLILSSLSNISWVGLVGGNQTTAASVGGGSKTLSATLDRIRITTVNGTDTFDAGSINILLE